MRTPLERKLRFRTHLWVEAKGEKWIIGKRREKTKTETTTGKKKEIKASFLWKFPMPFLKLSHFPPSFALIDIWEMVFGGKFYCITLPTIQTFSY